jgi:hypothetical protein
MTYAFVITHRQQAVAIAATGALILECKTGAAMCTLNQGRELIAANTQ